jgi:hypothetical protein
MMARLPVFLLVERHRVAAQISSRPPAAAMPGLSADLTATAGALVCRNRHWFDLAREG